jgi:hypothetical protein
MWIGASMTFFWKVGKGATHYFKKNQINTWATAAFSGRSIDLQVGNLKLDYLQIFHTHKTKTPFTLPQSKFSSCVIIG